MLRPWQLSYRGSWLGRVTHESGHTSRHFSCPLEQTALCHLGLYSFPMLWKRHPFPRIQWLPLLPGLQSVYRLTFLQRLFQVHVKLISSLLYIFLTCLLPSPLTVKATHTHTFCKTLKKKRVLTVGCRKASPWSQPVICSA